MELHPLGASVGVEVRGVDLAAADDSTALRLLEIINQHSTLLFRDQSLTDEQLVSFSRRFGSLDIAPVQEYGRTHVPGAPEIYVVSNILDDAGRPVGSLGTGEAVWHTDMSYLPVPPDFSLLYALEVPSTGGDTWLCGLTQALEDMPPSLRESLKGLSIKHDETYNSGGYTRKGVTASDDPITCAGRAHPLICAHPRTGRPTLYLGRRRNAYIMGLPLKESESLLNKLWAHATKPEYVYVHRWRVGDLLMWDNRTTMHRRDSFDPDMRRLMHRTQVQGKAPPYPAA